MTYQSEHADALADVEAAGAAVTFTLVTQTYDAETDTSTPATTTVSGHAVRVRGNPRQYEALGLVEASTPTLLFVPTTYGEEPELGATVVWNGETYTVRDVAPLAPDGSAILSRVVVSR